MIEQRFRVGIVGLEPGRGWAVRAHVPALRALSDCYEIDAIGTLHLHVDSGVSRCKTLQFRLPGEMPSRSPLDHQDEVPPTRA
jgi:hypothetical protein